MLTLDVMDSVRLSARPRAQSFFGRILGLNFQFPPTKTEIRIEGLEHLPSDRPVYLAMNHTDRFNSFPFQIEMMTRYHRHAATWVKGKYFKNPLLRRFLVATCNIPTPSRGYLITSDVAQTLGTPPTDALYRLLRRAIDEGWSDTELLEAAAAPAAADNLVPAVKTLVETDRDMLGLAYRAGDGYAGAMGTLFDQMMERFVSLNIQAFDLGLDVLVFPEGTRSKQLTVGRTGLAQMALRTGHPIVPIGCSGSGDVYSGDLPFARGGEVIYRIGEPIEHDGELAPFQIDQSYTPFTDSAAAHAEAFRGATEVVMDRINELLDPRYRREAGEGTALEGAERFL